MGERISWKLLTGGNRSRFFGEVSEGVSACRPRPGASECAMIHRNPNDLQAPSCQVTSGGARQSHLKWGNEWGKGFRSALPTLALAAVLASASAWAQPADICVPGYAREHRMPAAEAHAIKLEMMRREHPGEPLTAYTLDHVRPLCLGGANDRSNLQLQTVDEAKRKDVDEWRLCRAVCAGWISLDDAQRQMREWRPR